MQALQWHGTRSAIRFGLWRRTYAQATSASEKPVESPVVTEALEKAWDAVAPTLDFPKVPSNFMKQRPPVPAAIPSKITVNFVVPRRVEIQAQEMESVILPAASGVMGVLPGHVASIAQLRPGLVAFNDGKETKKYVVSGGFAFVHANSVTDIMAVEAHPVSDFDIEEARRGLAEYTGKLTSSTNDLAKAEAQIGVEVYGGLLAALS